MHYEIYASTWMNLIEFRDWFSPKAMQYEHLCINLVCIMNNSTVVCFQVSRFLSFWKPGNQSKPMEMWKLNGHLPDGRGQPIHEVDDDEHRGGPTLTAPHYPYYP